MDLQLIAAIDRLTIAHERLADNLSRLADAQIRIADSLKYTEGRISDLSLADGLVNAVERAARSLEDIETKMPSDGSGED